MTFADVRERLARDPFEPFLVRSSSGETYPVLGPFQAALMRSKVFIAAPNSDRWPELSYLHIAALEALANGQARRSGRGGRRR